MCFRILSHQDVDSAEGCAYVGVKVCGESLCSAQFCCEFITALNIKSIIKVKKSTRGMPQTSAHVFTTSDSDQNLRTSVGYNLGSSESIAEAEGFCAIILLGSNVMEKENEAG